MTRCVNLRPLNLILPLCLLFLQLIPLVDLQAMPAQIIIIRHAEEPDDDDNNYLNDKGYRRAQALVDFFSLHPSVNEYGNPLAIYAQSPKDDSGSLRCQLTLTPTAEHLQVPFHLQYSKKKYPALVKEIKNEESYKGGMVLIAWGSGMIPELAEELGVPSAPKWDKGQFDRLWVLDYNKKGKLVKFRDLPQNLFRGDSHYQKSISYR